MLGAGRLLFIFIIYQTGLEYVLLGHTKIENILLKNVVKHQVLIALANSENYLRLSSFYHLRPRYNIKHGKRNSFWFSGNKFSQFSRSDSLKGLSQPNCGKAEMLFYILPKVACVAWQRGNVLLVEMQFPRFSKTFTF